MDLPGSTAGSGGADRASSGLFLLVPLMTVVPSALAQRFSGLGSDGLWVVRCAVVDAWYLRPCMAECSVKRSSGPGTGQ